MLAATAYTCATVHNLRASLRKSSKLHSTRYARLPLNSVGWRRAELQPGAGLAYSLITASMHPTDRMHSGTVGSAGRLGSNNMGGRLVCGALSCHVDTLQSSAAAHGRLALLTERSGADGSPKLAPVRYTTVTLSGGHRSVMCRTLSIELFGVKVLRYTLALRCGVHELARCDWHWKKVDEHEMRFDTLAQCTNRGLVVPVSLCLVAQ
jgi:hypothetical protein